MKIVCVIPARLASTRFPRKVLSTFGDKPLLQWIWERATAVDCFDDVAFAIDDLETARLLDTFGGNYFMTSPDCPSGTDRLIQLQQETKLSGDIWVNWQGDEPFIHEEMIHNLLQSIDAPCDVWSLKKRIEKREEMQDPNVVKVVTDRLGKALYFSRSPIPYNRDGLGDAPMYKHIGIYAYRSTALQQIGQFPPSSLEQLERLEQLRYLENGLTIQVHETTRETLGIDTPEDLVKAMAQISVDAPFSARK